MIIMETNKGTIKIELRPDLTPNTVNNFLNYVDNGHYNGLIFHRVLEGLLVQGGGFSTDLAQKPTKDAIKNEADKGISNTRGTFAMVRTSGVDSATSQFFINVADNSHLNFKDETPKGYGYTAFGTVIEGMDVVDSIAKMPTNSKEGHQNVPVEEVVITSVTRQ